MAVHPSSLLIQSTINAGAPVVETTVNPVTTIVEAPIDTVTFMIEAVSETVSTSIRGAVRMSVKATINPVTSIVEAIVNPISTVIESILDTVTAIVQAFQPHPGLVRPDRTAKQADQQHEHRDLDVIPKLPCIHIHSPCFNPGPSASAPYNGTPVRWLTIGVSQFCIMFNWLTEP